MTRRPISWLALTLAAVLAAAAAPALAQPITFSELGEGKHPASGPVAPQSRVWTKERAAAWYRQQPFLLGANFQPSTAINQLDMFQAATFDPATIDRELGWAASKFGMNVMRVYLHDMLWAEDPQGFLRRLDQYLAISDRHGIQTVFVLFDSVWNPDSTLGPQHPPVPGVHNSGWLQTPDRHDLVNPRKDAHFEAYVKGVVGRFANDRRVSFWDIWNEPDNPGGDAYLDKQLHDEQRRIAHLLPRAFAWARQAGASQPLTSGVWIGPDWSPTSKTLTRLQRIQLAESDVITFHNYDWPEQFEDRLRQLKPYGRPIINTEWMARGNGSTADTILPIAVRENVGMINWGLVDGETQTRFPWDSWERPYVLKGPTLWFHDLMHADGRPYRDREAELFRQAAARARAPAAGSR
jgi:hypothetical protein